MALARAKAAVLVPSAAVPDVTAASTAAAAEKHTDAAGVAVRGFDFNASLRAGRVDYDALFASYATTGFQATNLQKAVEQINEMLLWRLSHEPADPDDELKDPTVRAATRCTIYLGFTSNMISCGLREHIRFLVEHKMVSVLVTTGGAIEEDIMKCFNPHFIGDFKLSGRALRQQGINRLGNLLVPNKNYCNLEDWIMPILDEMLDEQKTKGVVWTPSKMIRRFGERIDNPESVWHWAAKVLPHSYPALTLMRVQNDIPVFCPAITDGSIGDMIYFHQFQNPGLIVDIAGDIAAINNTAMEARKTGMIILGAGLVKHHVCNANLMRNGADFSVYVNTASEYDGSDAGAAPDEAISWGKIRLDARPVKVYGDASLLFPILVSQSFVKYLQSERAHDGEEKPSESAK